MIKFAQSDISDGLTQAKVGITNIIESLKHHDFQTYTLTIGLNGYLVAELIIFAYPMATIDRINHSFVSMLIDGCNILIYCNEDEVTFEIKDD